MADNTTTILSGGVSTTVQQDYSVTDLAPNNYLTIIWKNSAGEQFDNLDINETEANQFTNDLNNAIEQGISNGKVSYAGSKKYVNVESVAKYLAQNVIKSSSKRTVVNALIGLASGDEKNLTNSVKSLCINVFGNIADKVAKNFGFSDPFEVFSSFAGENTIEFFSELGNKAKDYIDEATSKFRKKKQEETQTQSVTTSTTEESTVKTTKKYIGFVFGLTTSDTESYEILIPRKKVEDGSDYTTHLLPQRFKKDFSVILTNKVLTSNYDKEIEIDNIESVKNKLIEIANSRILFDIYIRLSTGKCYKRSNVYFSSISFTKDENSGNNYTCSFTVEPIESFKSKVYVSNRKYFPTASKTSGTGTGKKSGSSGNKSNTGGSSGSGKNGPIVVDWIDHSGVLQQQSFSTVREAIDYANKVNCFLLEIPDANPPYQLKSKSGCVSVYLPNKKKYQTVLRQDAHKGSKTFNEDPKKYYLNDGTRAGQSYFVRIDSQGYVDVGLGVRKYKVLK